MLFALIATVGISLAPPGTVEADSLEAIHRVGFLLRQRYVGNAWWAWRQGGASRRRVSRGRAFDWLCDGDRDDVCFANDPDAGMCPNFVQCHPSPNRLVDVLVESSAEYPASGYLTGQAVYILTKLDRLPEAMRVVDGCEAAEWWCGALRVYVLHALGEEASADTLLHRTLAAAPDSIACAYSDATWLLGRWSQRGARLSVPDAREETEEWDCRRRMALSDSIWWLAEPLYTVPGNDRWIEHFTRSLSARFRAEIHQTMQTSPGPVRYQEHLWSGRVRRGLVDSYDAHMGSTWTSRYAASYHFVPDVGTDGPVWRLDAELDDEGYTPALGPFVPLPNQLARFRVGGDSLRIAVATRVADTPIAGALDERAAFVLTDAPGSVPLRLAADVRGPRTRFLGQAPSRRYVASLEVVTSKGIGWNRQVIEPLRPAGAELSDLLLYDPPPEEQPLDHLAATARMLGGSRVRAGTGVGVYWETYGAPGGATLQIDLALERRSGGLVDRLRRLLPGGGEEGRGRIHWSEPASGPVHHSAIAVDLDDLDGGDYTLVLSVGWPGQPPIERRRELSIGSR